MLSNILIFMDQLHGGIIFVNIVDLFDGADQGLYAHTILLESRTIILELFEVEVNSITRLIFQVKWR
jgi:hypothetical protein